MVTVRKENPFQSHVGIILENVDKNGCLVSLELEPKHYNLYGIPHGGVHSTLLDITMGVAASFSDNIKEKVATITLNLNVNFISKAKSNKIFAKGTVSKTSRKIAFCEGKVLDTDGSILATGSGVFKLIRD